MLRVVLDSVALTSALLNPHGYAARAFDYAIEGCVRLFTTRRMLETESLLLQHPRVRSRLGMSDGELADFIADLPVLFCLAPEAAADDVTRDPEAELLWCAEASHADVLALSAPLAVQDDPPEGTQVIRIDQLVELVDRGA